MAGVNGHYRNRINDADLAGETGEDGETFLYQWLPDGTWGPTSASNYPIGRRGFAAAAAVG